MTDRVTQLERQVRTLLAIATIPMALSIYLAFRAPTDPEWPSTSGHISLENGVTVFARPTRGHLTTVNLLAEGTGSTLSVGVDAARIVQQMTNGHPIISWIADGRVKSKVRIDTATGEWTIVRSYYNATSATTQNEERRLLGPLSE